MTNQHTVDKLISRIGVGRILECSTRSVARYASNGQIPPPVRLSGLTKWKLSDINLFLECNCNMPEFKARKETDNAN